MIQRLNKYRHTLAHDKLVKLLVFLFISFRLEVMTHNKRNWPVSPWTGSQTFPDIVKLSVKEQARGQSTAARSPVVCDHVQRCRIRRHRSPAKLTRSQPSSSASVTQGFGPLMSEGTSSASPKNRVLSLWNMLGDGIWDSWGKSALVSFASVLIPGSVLWLQSHRGAGRLVQCRSKVSLGICAKACQV